MSVRLFNRSTQPLVPADVGWGAGVVMPGESFLTDSPEGYAPNQPGSPWVTDEEAERALAERATVSLSAATEEEGRDVSSDSPSEGVSGAENAPHGGYPDSPASEVIKAAQNHLTTATQGADTAIKAAQAALTNDPPNQAETDQGGTA